MGHRAGNRVSQQDTSVCPSRSGEEIEGRHIAVLDPDEAGYRMEYGNLAATGLFTAVSNSSDEILHNTGNRAPLVVEMKTGRA